ncbi:MAG: leucine--tRNA ligase [Candidatus Buchananbacteria bacterium RIFCSPHIGHO2_02_FULL_56_16]|uniref:Leucine--tRNA ligase n=1 Tax=Candidatus Buchananbacteria bacterium RIFCSPHIGHO2_02_FULL_56_16 TaxID=1797542 RepID=A0A1G1YI30_9BACT|nr:MAG: leucine--tRNA ligase [Candidatus Buchananbacteria bacterium RIFCSPHIGHO2_02_FULL_56_16]
MASYDPNIIEPKWQTYWEEKKLFAAADRSSKPKYYCLIEFPYPSGEGLHVGHPRPYTALDVLARKRRMQGYNVLYPIGFDAFGLPTENYAIKTGAHPQTITERNVATFTAQLKALGLSFDWDRQVVTTDPAYYRWTQWIFLKLFEHGLAYKAKMPINWCPSCRIGLANEEVAGGACERCGTAVEQREKEQWLLKITRYADRLADDLAPVDYPERIKTQQINWIGRKEWIDIDYPVVGTNESVVVSTTRPDTNFGATFVVLAPEHPLVSAEKGLIPAERRKAVEQYIAAARKKTDQERMAEGRKKTGVFAGLYGLNRLNNKQLPIWISDFVLTTVGTGAVVGVPGHDRRDFEFATAFGLPVIRVVVGRDGDTSDLTRIEQVQEAEGTMVHSEFLDGLDIHRATAIIMDYLEKKGWGKRATRYNLRDWVFSRQRYWGEPIPLVFCGACQDKIKKQKSKSKNKEYSQGELLNPGWIAVPENQLPVALPEVKKYEPTDTGESPLATMTGWVTVTCPRCGGPARRETDTMPNWAGSNWYFLRYADPANAKALAAPDQLAYWLPVDWYNGGMEHTTLHLLYSRFIYKFLYDIKVVPESCGNEPYRKRTSHGLILGEGGEKMSKSRGNVVNPSEIVAAYGADTLRLYELFMGPFEQAIPWDTAGVRGVRRFLEKVWDTFERSELVSADHEDAAAKTLLHRTVKKVSDDIETQDYNTAVSALMILSNTLAGQPTISRSTAETFLRLLAPFAPHLAEERWRKLGHRRSIFQASWPAFDEKLIVATEITLVVQINGKVRDSLHAPADITEQVAERAARARPKIAGYLEGKQVKNIIFVPGRLINFVVE